MQLVEGFYILSQEGIMAGIKHITVCLLFGVGPRRAVSTSRCKLTWQFSHQPHTVLIQGFKLDNMKSEL